MLYNSALDHSIAHHKITCTRLLCTGRASEYRESHTKEGGCRYPQPLQQVKNQPDQANSVRYITKAKTRMHINLADSQGNDE